MSDWQDFVEEGEKALIEARSRRVQDEAKARSKKEWEEADFQIVTTPSVPGYKVKKVLGAVSGLTARTRGIAGRFIASIESMLGGEVSAFTSEMEKARIEALERLRDNALQLGANAAIGLDLETSEVFSGAVLISATATAVILEPE